MKAIDYIKAAGDKGVAIGHFNISDLAAFKAILKAAKEMDAPIFIGVSEGEREFVGVKQAAALVKSIREESGYPVFLNADHTYSLDKIKEVVEAGYDSVIFDGAKLSLEENIKKTREVVEYVKSKNSDILVEGELGYIGQSSKLLDKIPDGAGLSFTTPEEAKQYVDATGVDMLAPAVGNIHGMLKNQPEPRLDVERVGNIKKAVGVPLVLHGGSGNSKEDFQESIKRGINIVHINTEIRVAWRKGVEAFMAGNKEEVTPYKILKAAEDAVYGVVIEKLRIFNQR